MNITHAVLNVFNSFSGQNVVALRAFTASMADKNNKINMQRVGRPVRREQSV